MNQSVYQLFDPSLQEAVENWNSYASDSAQTDLVALRLFTPIKDWLQITQQTLEAIQARDWAPATTLPDPEVLNNIGSQLNEIQVAAFEKMVSGFTRYLETGAEAGKLFSETLTPGSDPQQQQQYFAAVLETGLKVTKAYQDDLNQQFADLNAIQSAYKAWWQQSLEALFSKG